jgi:hypothetical protein
MIDYTLDAVRAAGIGVVESVATVNGIETGELFNELYPFCSESTTPRRARAPCDPR